MGVSIDSHISMYENRYIAITAVLTCVINFARVMLLCICIRSFVLPLFRGSQAITFIDN